MKFRLLFLLAILLSQTYTVSAVEYSDITDEYKYFKSIADFSDKGILEGYPDGTFKPDQPINRAEALKVILKAFEIESSKTKADETTQKFSDVDAEQWFYEFVINGYENKIIEGYQDGTFQPGNQVLFAESLKMGLVASGIDFEKIDFAGFHPSVKAEDWFAKYFSLGFEKNLISLEKNGGLNPLRPYNRGEFVDLIYKIKNVNAADPNSKFDITYNWKEEVNSQGLRLSFPFEWEYFTLGEGVFLGYFAGQNPTFIRNVPNGARISINFWSNSELESPKNYFEKVRLRVENEYRPLEISFEETDNQLTIFVKDAGIYEYYKFMDENQILIAEGSFDSKSLKALDLVKEIKEIFNKIEFDTRLTLTASQKLEVARKNIAVAGKGKEVLNSFIEKELFETYALGLGSGPVDYYYIIGINHTIKYERSNDVIIDIQPEKTSNF